MILRCIDGRTLGSLEALKFDRLSIIDHRRKPRMTGHCAASVLGHRRGVAPFTPLARRGCTLRWHFLLYGKKSENYTSYFFENVLKKLATFLTF